MQPRGPGEPTRPLDGASTAGDGGEDLDLAAVLDLRLQALAEPHVLAVDVDVDEAPQRAAVVGEPLAQLRVLAVQPVEHRPDRRPLDRDLRLPAGRGAQLGRDLHRDGHHATAPAWTLLSNCSNRGSISCASKVSRTASSVLRPSPVMTSTTRSPGPMSPRSASFASVAVVVPPAVSVKMPVVSASSRMPALISSSSTASIAPPLARASSSAYGPSAGLPIASDLAIVSGLTGRQTSTPASNAAATGEQPSAWAPFMTGASPSTRPRERHSSKPLAIFVYNEPEAIGATTRSGVRNPSCSAISYASVFEPSA